MNIQRAPVIVTAVALSVVALATVTFVLGTPQGARGILKAYVKNLPAGLKLTYGRVEGNLWRGLDVGDVTLSGISFFPAGTSAKAERVRVFVPRAFPVRLRLEATNGKLGFPNGSTVFFRGTYSDRKLDANVFGPGANFATVALLLPRARILRDVTGRVEDIDIFISGTFRQPRFSGHFLVPEAALTHLALRDLRCSLKLTLNAAEGRTLLFGEVALSPATVFLRRTQINVSSGKIIFNGEPDRFAIRVSGTSRVEDTDIALQLSGTLDKPDFRVTSLPAMPQDKLLLMLLTGKAWASTQEAQEKGVLTTDVAKDFVDFLFLGGTGTTLSEKLGVESVHLTYDARTQGIEVKKSLTDSASVIYGITEAKQDALTQSEAVQTQKVGVEYKLTDKVSLEGSQEFRQPMNATQQVLPEPESSIQLKYKKKF